MLKKPNPQLFRLIKKTAAFLIFAETAAFAGTYLAWYKLNTSRDFRYYFHTNYPVVLEGYYKVGEYFGKAQETNQARLADLEVWTALKNKEN